MSEISLSAHKITDRLAKKEIKITILETVDSTNTYLKKSITDASLEGEVVIAASQSAGRGRLGRSFYSPNGSGIYMSILLRPQFSPEKAVLITAAAAVAVCEACESLGSKRAEIKWVNDVYINSKKVCGILTEGAINPENSNFEYAILGIGVNVFAPEDGFGADLREIAGAAFSDPEPYLRERLCAEIINRFMDYYSSIRNKDFLVEYKKRCFTVGKMVTVISGDSATDATAIALDDDCRMLVEYPDGEREYIASGEISIKPKK